MKSPRMGYHDSLKKIQSTKHRVLRPYPRRVRYYPPGNSTQITRGLGGYTHRVRLRTPSGELTPILPLGDSTQITRGLHPSGELVGTLWRTNSDKIETPPERFYPNHLGAQGLLSGT